jgi:hypothetical protein
MKQRERSKYSVSATERQDPDRESSFLITSRVSGFYVRPSIAPLLNLAAVSRHSMAEPTSIPRSLKFDAGTHSPGRALSLVVYMQASKAAPFFVADV